MSLCIKDLGTKVYSRYINALKYLEIIGFFYQLTFQDFWLVSNN
jgi:hypothetical protein